MTDQVMPLQLGTELLEQVRARSPATLRAVLTAFPDGGTLLRKWKGDNLCVIAKPWDDEGLKRTIQALLHA